MRFHLSPKAKRNISRIIPFGIIWFFLGNIFLYVEIAALGDSAAVATSAIQINFQIYIFASLAVIMVGLLVGSIEVIYLSNRFNDKSLSQKIIYKTIIYILFLFIIILITFPVAASLELNTSVLDPIVWEKYLVFLKSKTFISTNVQLAVELLVSLFYFEISENMGHNVMIKFLSGRYHEPTQERRVFMFLDMRSSTSNAEKLGHLQYFEFLKTYYKDLSDSIIEYEGEIYQYVGDEIIVSWPLEKGIANFNCIRCFLTMKADLQSRSDLYLKTFGLEPSFKAGLHCGDVTSGEIGALKKEIIYTGDTLNATSRIQSLCNAYKVDILLSEELIQVLPSSSDFQFTSLGQTVLKGKKENVVLFTINTLKDIR